MLYQVYEIHLIDGSTLEYLEDFNTPWEQCIIHRLMCSNDNDVISVPGFPNTKVFIPKRSIVCITVEGIKNIQEASDGKKDQ